MAGKAGSAEAHHRVAGRIFVNPAADPGNHAGKLQAEAGASEAMLDGLVGQEAHDVHHVAEIEAGGHGADFDLVRSKHPFRLFEPDQVTQLAGDSEIEPVAPVRRRLGDRNTELRALHAQHMTAARLQDDFTFAIWIEQLVNQQFGHGSDFARTGQVDQLAGKPGVLVHDHPAQAPQGRVPRIATRSSDQAVDGDAVSGHEIELRRAGLGAERLDEVERLDRQGDVITAATGGNEHDMVERAIEFVAVIVKQRDRGITAGEICVTCDADRHLALDDHPLLQGQSNFAG